ncbi:DNA-methyltransferase [Segnochrobactrum spirostomi]|uniref:Site-specific DNA-methyltransferase n=1 Tax=Segnochrobactrum spirostomi TaxID=2608987 RepID=A0A6A7Y6D0_9HYPH|nr:site-specific DNA-methyltransferase [Segnochrobactrum spirostomi]MQT13628.1 site-specific DNA-methyltransferase [Segnochrobactrum spirostomi]
MIDRIGSATLHLGDALEILTTLERGVFDALIADPPYCSGGTTAGERIAVPSRKYQTSSDRGLYPEFAGDTMDQRSFYAWSTLWLSRARAAVRPGGIAAVFSDWRQLPVTTDALQAAGWIWRGIAVWDKTERCRPQLGRYRQQAEYVVWGTNGPRPLAGPVAPGVLRAGVPRFKRHIAGKPIEVMEGLLAVVDGPVLDPFMGSAPVGLACARRGLAYLGIEVVPEIYRIAVDRLTAGPDA